MTPLDYRCLPIGLLALLLAIPLTARTSDAAPAEPIPQKVPAAAQHVLRYKFQPGETLRWDVVHRKRVQATFGGSTQVTESVDRSTKCWRVVEVDSEGGAVVEHMVTDAVFDSAVENVDARTKQTTRNEFRYDSKKDKKPPPAFEDVAKRLGKPLARFKLDNRGQTLDRTALMSEPASREKPQLTIPLPEHPIAVGQRWQQRHEVLLPLEMGATKTIVVQQVFTLKSVKTGVATIDVANQVLTPIHSPELEAKLIERYKQGTVRFDVDAGRILSQRMDLDRRVVGFRGIDSCLHHLTRSTEQLLPQKTGVAARPDQPRK